MQIKMNDSRLFIDITGHQIANNLNIEYDGIQKLDNGEFIMQFTDPITHSTTYGNSETEIRLKIKGLRKFFETS